MNAPRLLAAVAVCAGLLALPTVAQEVGRRTLLQGTHERLAFDKDVQRVALGDGEVAATVEIDTRQLLVLGKKPGRTTLIVWFKDGSTRELTLVVQRDLSLLQEALAEIHSGIVADLAPDRDAVVLRGVVPDLATMLAAEALTDRYLSAQGDARDVLVAGGTSESTTQIERPGQPPEVHRTTTTTSSSSGDRPGRRSHAVINLLRLERLPLPLEARVEEALRRAGGAGVSVRRVTAGGTPNDELDLFVVEGAVRDAAARGRVLRLAERLVPQGRLEPLLRVDAAAPEGPSGGGDLIEERLLLAVRPAGGERVTVRRVVRGPLPDDARDSFVLEGRVRTQVELVRCLTVAARLLGADDGANGADIRVLADEAGAVTGGRGQQGQQGQQGGGQGGQGGQGFGLGGGGQQRLTNRVQQNVGRAKALSVADGRVLSFIEVDDLPQVRVLLRFYEVDRAKLEQADIDFSVTDSDAVVNPTNASRPNRSDVDATNVLSFLQGRLGDQFQLVGRKVSLTATFQLLETEGLARSLSSPTLTVLSGESANFTVGGEVPIPVAFSPALGGDGPTATGVFNGVEFRQFGVQLAVRPLVGDDDTITLDLAPQVIQPDAGLTELLRQTTGTAQQTTAFQTRSLRTSARLQDGQALLLGGLTTRSRQSDAAFTPLLHKVPVVEWLFQDTRDARNEVELVVLVNPVIVREPRSDAGLWAFPDARELLGGIRRRLAERAKHEDR